MATTENNQPIPPEEEKEISSLLESIKIDDEKMTDLTEEQKETLKKLKLYQKEYYDYESKFEYELFLLRQKYHDLYGPIYDKRREALVGNGEAKIGTPNLPEFWLRALRNNNTVSHVIEDHDEEILVYLNDIRCDYIKKNKEKKEGFILSFHFAPNPFFSNSVLTKTYHMKCVDCDNEPVLLHTEATVIDWYDNKNILKKNVVKKQHNKNSREVKTVQQTVNRDSFFHFFTSHKVPNSNVIKQLSKHEVAQLEMIIEGDYEVALTIKERIIPYAVDYFLGIIIESESNSIVSDVDSSYSSSENNSNYNSYESNNSAYNDENSNVDTNEFDDNEEDEEDGAKSNEEALTS
ncbi:nucleosome assembly protein, putative [Plasmodium knowlesi strain H]|uniref:Nucleosome assembly protein, putative n=3 Tax=Plasmodium knowlesi TaxID=5850 RepID=A0A5K1UYZ6_PLAKH|nr:nucleosome assembly protein, putative [Plasmodium knowlesi strain H]OTN66895.1 putative Nucleosome assembly protein 1 [Plasmodium knowlesi]CAA9990075.1 nucleosome assembly protein, putative [Plasmodium knowlesi strain H]SBO25739.1 nucleosome assembly protein, putative [Plasmodium knowlesi strain H]SBO28547.1 nucleosome assembly protein, putative [Plasmodium knowlesi strain H]VVS79549.1 nucleosome assembly protein, putative [Plasmodium knowlesi strain H]|eukprot:XP_002260542.1 nucleosome assembly protein 1, putative [Plasmodium knowlesi strain H]